MGKICRAYDYSTAEESRKPGYLKAKFDKLRREQTAAKAKQEAAQAEAAVKVSPLKRTKA